MGVRGPDGDPGLAVSMLCHLNEFCHLVCFNQVHAIRNTMTFCKYVLHVHMKG